MRSNVITLLTDFGTIDQYVAMMKGVIISINPRGNIVDITHQVAVGAINQAAHLIGDTYPYYPEGTVHVVVVDPGVGSARRPICVEAGGHFFVGPDNGVLWPVIEKDQDCRVIHITNREYFLKGVSNTFHGRDIFAPVGAHISKGIAIREFGKSIDDPVELNSPEPRREGDTLKGQIMKIDNFGNLISNITAEDLRDFLGSDSLRIIISEQEIEGLHSNYSEVDAGEVLALINSSDLLEIAVSLGRASEYIRSDSGDLIGQEIILKRMD